MAAHRLRTLELALPALDPFVDGAGGPQRRRPAGGAASSASRARRATSAVVVQRDGDVVLEQTHPVLQKQGVIVCSMDRAMREHDEKLQAALRLAAARPTTTAGTRRGRGAALGRRVRVGAERRAGRAARAAASVARRRRLAGAAHGRDRGGRRLAHRDRGAALGPRKGRRSSCGGTEVFVGAQRQADVREPAGVGPQRVALLQRAGASSGATPSCTGSRSCSAAA